MNGWATTTTTATAPAGGPARLAHVPGHLFALFTTTPVDQRAA